jgi:hypothetical protein
VSLLGAITAIQTQLREAGKEASVYVADNGVYSETKWQIVATVSLNQEQLAQEAFRNAC